MAGVKKPGWQAQQAYVLHTYPFRETSLVVEILTRESGRVALVARGARRPRSAVRGLLLPFQPLLISWFGKSELRTLHSAEWTGGQPQLRGMALLCGFYINELLVKLLQREDPHEQLFDIYRQTVEALAGGTFETTGGVPRSLSNREFSVILRQFERRLLQELGYALALDREAESNAPVDAGHEYLYLVDRGPVRMGAPRGHQKGVQLRGKTLLDMAQDEYSDPVTLLQSKQLTRTLINHHLGGQALFTRQLLKDLNQL